MRKEYYNYVVKLPVLLHELFRGKVADYHFSDMTVVMNHLVKSYIRMTDGGRVSTATRRILLCMDRIPESLGRIADRVFEVRGSTLKDFRRQCLVSIRTNTIGPDRIASFMEKHGIASAREFLRRVVLFFLEARYLIYRKEVELDEDDLPEEEETDWEETMYSQYQKRDFAISTYNY